jgi:predicted O-linked N-acetylglucosamine transferase (SPINDLY family)
MIATIDDALRYHRAGNLKEAERIYREILQADLCNRHAWHLLGVIAHQVGQSSLAIDYIGRAVALGASDAFVYNNLGEAYRAVGRLADSEACYRQAIRLQPDYAEAHNNLGATLQDLSKWSDAQACHEQALRLQPNYTEAHNNLGLVYHQQNRLDEAQRCYQQALSINPQYAAAHLNLGRIVRQLARPAEAITCFQRALELRPDFGEAQDHLGQVFHSQGRLAEARGCFEKLLRLRPDHAPAYVSLGAVLQEQGRLAEAQGCYEQALRMAPNYPEAHNNLGTCLRKQARVDEAAASYRTALRLRPDYAAACNNFAAALLDLGQVDEAVAHYREALRLTPDFAHAHSGLLFCLSHKVDITPDDLFAEHLRWGEVHGTVRPWTTHDNERRCDRPLRIGYVSPDFFGHPVTRFLEPVLANHDPTAFEVFCYAEVITPDTVTERLRSLVPAWRSTRGLTDLQLAEQIRADHIDILVDLTGHTSKNRLRAFAYKPAPVQVTWIGYPHTTGLRAMDYRLTDAVMDPPGEPKHGTEEQMRLPRGLCCFAAPVQAPDVGPLPALRNGYVTLGSLHKLSKINSAVVEVWCRILQRLPSVRLLVFRDTLVGDTCTRLARQFAERGIGDDRLELRHEAGARDYLELFADVDLGLDPFPYTGGTISCQSLWMGVPFVTLRGDRPAGRAGAALLTMVGLPDLVAASHEEVVALTVALATDLPRLGALRAGLRERMLRTLCDGAAFTRDLEAAYRQMWHTWCARQSR